MVQAWGLLVDQHRALLSCLTDMLTEPECFLQAADMLTLVYNESSESDREWLLSRLNAIRRDCLYSQTRHTVVEIFIRLGIPV